MVPRALFTLGSLNEPENMVHPIKKLFYIVISHFNCSNFFQRALFNNIEFHHFQVHFFGLQNMKSSPPSLLYFSIYLAILICGGGRAGWWSQLFEWCLYAAAQEAKGFTAHFFAFASLRINLMKIWSTYGGFAILIGKLLIFVHAKSRVFF